MAKTIPKDDRTGMNYSGPTAPPLVVLLLLENT